MCFFMLFAAKNSFEIFLFDQFDGTIEMILSANIELGQRSVWYFFL